MSVSSSSVSSSSVPLAALEQLTAPRKSDHLEPLSRRERITKRPVQPIPKAAPAKSSKPRSLSSRPSAPSASSSSSAVPVQLTHDDRSVLQFELERYIAKLAAEDERLRQMEEKNEASARLAQSAIDRSVPEISQFGLELRQFSAQSPVIAPLTIKTPNEKSSKGILKGVQDGGSHLKSPVKSDSSSIGFDYSALVDRIKKLQEEKFDTQLDPPPLNDPSNASVSSSVPEFGFGCHLDTFNLLPPSSEDSISHLRSEIHSRLAALELDDEFQSLKAEIRRGNLDVESIFQERQTAIAFQQRKQQEIREKMAKIKEKEKNDKPNAKAPTKAGVKGKKAGDMKPTYPFMNLLQQLFSGANAIPAQTAQQQSMQNGQQTTGEEKVQEPEQSSTKQNTATKGIKPSSAPKQPSQNASKKAPQSESPMEEQVRPIVPATPVQLPASSIIASPAPSAAAPVSSAAVSSVPAVVSPPVPAPTPAILPPPHSYPSVASAPISSIIPYSHLPSVGPVPISTLFPPANLQTFEAVWDTFPARHDAATSTDPPAKSPVRSSRSPEKRKRSDRDAASSPVRPAAAWPEKSAPEPDQNPFRVIEAAERESAISAGRAPVIQPSEAEITEKLLENLLSAPPKSYSEEEIEILTKRKLESAAAELDSDAAEELKVPEPFFDASRAAVIPDADLLNLLARAFDTADDSKVDAEWARLVSQEEIDEETGEKLNSSVHHARPNGKKLLEELAEKEKREREEKEKMRAAEEEKARKEKEAEEAERKRIADIEAAAEAARLEERRKFEAELAAKAAEEKRKQELQDAVKKALEEHQKAVDEERRKLEAEAEAKRAAQAAMEAEIQRRVAEIEAERLKHWKAAAEELKQKEDQLAALEAAQAEEKRKAAEEAEKAAKLLKEAEEKQRAEAANAAGPALPASAMSAIAQAAVEAELAKFKAAQAAKGEADDEADLLVQRREELERMKRERENELNLKIISQLKGEIDVLKERLELEDAKALRSPGERNPAPHNAPVRNKEKTTLEELLAESSEDSIGFHERTSEASTDSSSSFSDSMTDEAAAALLAQTRGVTMLPFDPLVPPPKVQAPKQKKVRMDLSEGELAESGMISGSDLSMADEELSTVDYPPQSRLAPSAVPAYLMSPGAIPFSPIPHAASPAVDRSMSSVPLSHSLDLSEGEMTPRGTRMLIEGHLMPAFPSHSEPRPLSAASDIQSKLKLIKPKAAKKAAASSLSLSSASDSSLSMSQSSSSLSMSTSPEDLSPSEARAVQKFKEKEKAKRNAKEEKFQRQMAELTGSKQAIKSQRPKVEIVYKIRNKPVPAKQRLQTALKQAQPERGTPDSRKQKSAPGTRKPAPEVTSPGAISMDSDPRTSHSDRGSGTDSPIFTAIPKPQQPVIDSRAVAQPQSQPATVDVQPPSVHPQQQPAAISASVPDPSPAPAAVSAPVSIPPSSAVPASVPSLSLQPSHDPEFSHDLSIASDADLNESVAVPSGQERKPLTLDDYDKPKSEKPRKQLGSHLMSRALAEDSSLDESDIIEAATVKSHKQPAQSEIPKSPAPLTAADFLQSSDAADVSMESAPGAFLTAISSSQLSMDGLESKQPDRQISEPSKPAAAYRPIPASISLPSSTGPSPLTSPLTDSFDRPTLLGAMRPLHRRPLGPRIPIRKSAENAFNAFDEEEKKRKELEDRLSAQSSPTAKEEKSAPAPVHSEPAKSAEDLEAEKRDRAARMAEILEAASKRAKELEDRVESEGEISNGSEVDISVNEEEWIDKL